jgi:hypothetical protein
MRRFVKYWLPLLIWLGVIFVGSTSVISAEHTSPIHPSLLAPVETRHVAKGNFDNSHRCSQMCARYRIRGSSSSAVASTSQRSSSPYKNVDGFWRSSAGLRTFWRERRISPGVR